MKVRKMVCSGPARSLGSDSLATSGGLTTRESFSVVQSGLLAGHRGGGSGSKCLLPTCVHRGYEIEWGCRVVLGARFCSELSRRGEIANHCSNDFGLAVVSGVKYSNQIQEPELAINLDCRATSSVTEEIYADRLGVGGCPVASDGSGDRSKGPSNCCENRRI